MFAKKAVPLHSKSEIGFGCTFYIYNLVISIQKRTILKCTQKMLDFNVYLPSVSSGVFRHSLADSAPSGKTNKIYLW